MKNSVYLNLYEANNSKPVCSAFVEYPAGQIPADPIELSILLQ
jgi:hypothetical protein